MNANPHSIGRSLSAHHDQLDHQLDNVLKAARAAAWPEYRAQLGALNEALRLHMAFEDEALYPLLEARHPGAVRGLREQHAQLRRYIEMLGAAAPEQDPEGCIDVLETLAELQHRHHADEMELDPQYATRAVPQLPPLEPAAAAPMDLRGLQPPEPIVRIFQALEKGAAPLRVILPHEPLPLYGLLRERGYTYAGAPRAAGGFELLIEKP
jgi:hypothetical protein